MGSLEQWLATAPAAAECCRVQACKHTASSCLQAAREGNLSFGFSAGGCLFPYYVGVAGAMIDGGVLTGACPAASCRPPLCPPPIIKLSAALSPCCPRCVSAEQVKVGGASAGSLLAACLKSGMPLDDVVEQNLRLMADLRAGGTRGRLGVRGNAAGWG